MHATIHLDTRNNEDTITKPPLLGDQVIDPMLLMVKHGNKLVVVLTEILKRNLANTNIDGGFGVSALLEDT